MGAVLLGFRPDPGLAGLVVAVLGITWILGRRDRRRDLRHRLSLCAAGAVLTLAYISPLETLGRYYLLTAHLVQVTLVMALAAPLLVLSIPPRADPGTPRRLSPLAAITFPPAALLIVTLGFFAWHAAPVFDAALRQQPLYLLEQATYLVVAAIFWWPILEPAESRTAPAMSPFGRLAYVLIATIPQTFGGITIALMPHVIYAGYGSGPRALGLDPLTDQVIAGACIAVLNKIALFAAAVVVFVKMMREEEEEDDDDGGQRVREPAAPLPGPIPTWVRNLDSKPTSTEPLPRRRRQGAGTARV